MDLDKYGQVTPLLDVALIPRNDCAHVFVSEEEVLHLRNMMWNTASVTHVSRSGMLHGDDAMKDVWRDAEKMSSQRIRDVYLMQKTAQLMGVRYAILNSFADPMRIPKKLLQKGGLPGNYERI